MGSITPVTVCTSSTTLTPTHVAPDNASMRTAQEKEEATAVLVRALVETALAVNQLPTLIMALEKETEGSVRAYVASARQPIVLWGAVEGDDSIIVTKNMVHSSVHHGRQWLTARALRGRQFAGPTARRLPGL